MDSHAEPRPGLDAQQVMDAFYQAMSNALHADSDMAAGMSLEKIEQGLRYAGYPPSDGYEYAKSLENSGWSGISAQDIETLDCARGFLHRAKESAEADWVWRNSIKPPFTSSTRVRAQIHRVLPGGRRVERVVAEGRAYLDEKNSKIGRCLFRDDQWVQARGNEGGYLLAWEDIEIIEVTNG